MTKKNFTLTQEYLKEVLHYNQETGLFIREKSYTGSVKRGDIAGYEVHSRSGNHKRYMQISVKSKSYYAHRLAYLFMKGSWPETEIDHIDGNGLNNKWNNFRFVTKSENLKNKKMYSNNKTGCTGIYVSKSKKNGLQK